MMVCNIWIYGYLFIRFGRGAGRVGRGGGVGV